MQVIFSFTDLDQKLVEALVEAWYHKRKSESRYEHVLIRGLGVNII